MNAVIYTRYSSDSQREESIEGQLRECTDYANRSGMTVVGTYIGRAFSAKTADRPEFQHMIKDSAKGLFEVVLVWNLDRSADLSEKIHRGQKENALKGKNNGSGIPLGYLLDKETQKLVLNPETAPIVTEIFKRYSEGATVRSIIAERRSVRAASMQCSKTANVSASTATRMLSFPAVSLLSFRRICSIAFSSVWRKTNALPRWQRHTRIFCSRPSCFAENASV